jgi:hypothetical protein
MWSPLRSHAVIEAAEKRITDSRCFVQRVTYWRLERTERLIFDSERRISETLTVLLNLAAMADGLPSLRLAG